MAALNSHEPVAQKSGPSAAPAGISDQQLRWREALVLWLRWNEAYEHVTARMYQPGQDAQQIELLMDQMDQIRSQAIRLSQELLDLTIDRKNLAIDERMRKEAVRLCR